MSTFGYYLNPFNIGPSLFSANMYSYSFSSRYLIISVIFSCLLGISVNFFKENFDIKYIAAISVSVFLFCLFFYFAIKDPIQMEEDAVYYKGKKLNNDIENSKKDIDNLKYSINATDNPNEKHYLNKLKQQKELNLRAKINNYDNTPLSESQKNEFDENQENIKTDDNKKADLLISSIKEKQSILENQLNDTSGKYSDSDIFNLKRKVKEDKERLSSIVNDNRLENIEKKDDIHNIMDKKISSLDNTGDIRNALLKLKMEKISQKQERGQDTSREKEDIHNIKNNNFFTDMENKKPVVKDESKDESNSRLNLVKELESTNKKIDEKSNFETSKAYDEWNGEINKIELEHNEMMNKLTKPESKGWFSGILNPFGTSDKTGTDTDEILQRKMNSAEDEKDRKIDAANRKMDNLHTISETTASLEKLRASNTHTKKMEMLNKNRKGEPVPHTGEGTEENESTPAEKLVRGDSVTSIRDNLKEARSARKTLEKSRRGDVEKQLYTEKEDAEKERRNKLESKRKDLEKELEKEEGVRRDEDRAEEKARRDEDRAEEKERRNKPGNKRKELEKEEGVRRDEDRAAAKARRDEDRAAAKTKRDEDRDKEKNRGRDEKEEARKVVEENRKIQREEREEARKDKELNVKISKEARDTAESLDKKQKKDAAAAAAAAAAGGRVAP